MKYRIELTAEERDELGDLLEHVNLKYGYANGAIHTRIMNALRSASPVEDLVGRLVLHPCGETAKVIDPPVWIEFQDGRRVHHFPDDLRPVE